MSIKPAAALLTNDPVKSRSPKPTRASAEHRVIEDFKGGIARKEMNTSVSRVLLVLAMAFLLTNGLIWALVKYWLFAP